ncbi:septal ring lytic transglycosylase RlpA family protein, partial [Chryseobacterium sp.]
NDRGPFHSSRSLDMSKAAFDEIGDINHGTIPVEYEIVD